MDVLLSTLDCQMGSNFIRCRRSIVEKNVEGWSVFGESLLSEILKITETMSSHWRFE
jgi:hypothetical protein